MWIHDIFSFIEDTDVNFLPSYFAFIDSCPVACLLFARKEKCEVFSSALS